MSKVATRWAAAPPRSFPVLQSQKRSMGHTVRIIMTEDMPNGKAYKGEVVRVKAGHARNYLIPGKMALYATPANFDRLGMTDPDVVVETEEERRERLLAEAAAEEEGGEELRAADVLRHYLRNKVLKIWRNVDPTTNSVHPGMVDHKAVRSKLSKQLKIDLDRDEKVTLRATPVASHLELTDDDVETMLAEMGGPPPGDGGEEGDDEEEDKEECRVRIRELGEYVAKLSLRGGHSVPLKFVVLKR